MQNRSDSGVVEMTAKAVIVGVFFGVLFGAANSYLGLRIGMTISTSIPVAVLAVALFHLGSSFWGKPNILETNIAQTIGSASSSLASGLLFTVPALFLWGITPPFVQLGLLGLSGGVLGVLAMVPLRRMLIARNDPELPYPEGTACAVVLKSTQVGSKASRKATRWILIGLLVGLAVKVALSQFQLLPDVLSYEFPFLKKARLAIEVSPALIAVGYILGYRVASIIIAGSFIAALVLTPMIAQFGDALTSPVFPETKKAISEMSAGQIWSRYVRYIGAGTVAVAGFVTVFQTFPTMVDSIRKVLKGSRGTSAAGRKDRDLPGNLVILGVIGVVLFLASAPGVFAGEMGFFGRLICAIGVGLFGMLFVTVSSRIVGLVGVSSNPTSAMTIVTLLGVSLIFAMLGWVDGNAKAAVLTVGTVVAVAASIAGDTSQDLKTGYLVGGTPAKQQFSQLISVATACWAVAGTILLLGSTYEFGSSQLPAPQATLVKTVIDGVLSGNMPWDLIFIGGGLGVVATVLALPTLAFALGVYLPFAINSPIFLGGLLRRWLERKGEGSSKESDPGILCASGMIAGEGLGGVGVAGIAFLSGSKPTGDTLISGNLGVSIALILVAGLVLLLAKAAKRD